LSFYLLHDGDMLTPVRSARQGVGEGNVISIVIAKTNVCGERRDLFIWPFLFEWSNLGSAATFVLPNVGLDDHHAVELPQKCYSC